MKQLLLKALLLPGFPALLRYVQPNCAIIFMMHRFRDARLGIDGCDTVHLRRTLTYLIRNGYELLSLVDLFKRLEGNDILPRGAVAFTIDDGYVDQATIAAPLFAEHHCPVTTFVSTGFLDRNLWFWWDQIEYVFQHAPRRAVSVEIGDAVFTACWENEEERACGQAKFTAACKSIADNDRLTAIARLAQESEVEIPKAPPPRYAPMSWDQLRECEGMGMQFGPHTVTHPVLSRATSEAVDHEITESWSRLREEAQDPVPIFCYPNGQWKDFGDREIVTLRRLGFRGAVVAEPGYADSLTFRECEDALFKVQRFGFPDQLQHVIQYVSGVERIKQMIRQRSLNPNPLAAKP
jgi:peptidoglycan/xylan/chitin deacetylase (PgdA/CDA1 family)